MGVALPIGEREQANLVVRMARFFYIYLYNYITVCHLTAHAFELRLF